MQTFSWRASLAPGLARVQIAGDYMDHAINNNPEFTKWVVREGLLAEPFVLIDVGVQGDVNRRWQPLGDYLTVHGFDSIEEVVQQLTEANRGRPNRHYHFMAVGSSDGEMRFYFNPANPTASSMFPQGASRYGVETVEEVRNVPVRRLDSLLAEGTIPRADFLKVDVEGFERDVLLGAQSLLRAGILGLQTETNFGVSPYYPKGHFMTLAELALGSQLLVFDVVFDRIPRASFQRALVGKGLRAMRGQNVVGKPGTVDVLFCRDLIDEIDYPNNYQTQCRPVSLDQLIKMIIIYELHGLNDIALDTAERFAPRLGARLDIERAVWLLADPDCRSSESWQVNGYRTLIRAFAQLTRRRIAARMRRVKSLIYEPLA
jgi:FkbM family methyltransferase